MNNQQKVLDEIEVQFLSIYKKVQEREHEFQQLDDLEYNNLVYNSAVFEKRLEYLFTLFCVYKEIPNKEIMIHIAKLSSFIYDECNFGAKCDYSPFLNDRLTKISISASMLSSICLKMVGFHILQHDSILCGFKIKEESWSKAGLEY